MRLSFYGAAGEVTGSNYILETATATIAIDCGAFQGGKEQELKNVAPLLYKASEVDALVVTHAHLDHVGRIAKLVKDGFIGNIWCTPATEELMELIMLDAAKIMSHDELKFGEEPLYDEQDVAKAIAQVKRLDYDTRVQIAPGVDIRLVDAGHILGAAMIELWAEERKLVFSGDIGNPGAPIVRDPTQITDADYIICESTYGNRVHESSVEREDVLKAAIDASVAQQGVLLIPAFSLERTQELLHTLDHLLEEKKIAQIPIFLDSPLAIKATEVFQRYPQYFDEETSKDVANHNDPFDFPNLKLTRSIDESKAINQTPMPKIIIAGSGMMTGGRIMHHLNQYIDNPRAAILFVGYQAVGTLGRRILDGATEVDLFRATRQVKAHVAAAGSFSAHSDAPALLKWLEHFAVPRTIFLTHGDEESREALKQSAAKTISCPIILPRFGQHVTLE